MDNQRQILGLATDRQCEVAVNHKSVASGVGDRVHDRQLLGLERRLGVGKFFHGAAFGIIEIVGSGVTVAEGADQQLGVVG